MQRPEGLLGSANRSKGCWLAARSVDQPLQLRRDRHRPESSDPAATRVAMGQPPQRRLHGGSRDPKDLSHDLADVVLAHGPAQHEPVDPRVQPGRGLAEHVRARHSNAATASPSCSARRAASSSTSTADRMRSWKRDTSSSCEIGWMRPVEILLASPIGRLSKGLTSRHRSFMSPARARSRLLPAALTRWLPLAAAQTVATRPARRRRALPARRQGRRGGLASDWCIGMRC